MKNNKNEDQKENLHVVLRLGKFTEYPIRAEPIEEHNKISSQKGYVLLGKFGMRPSESIVHKITSAIKAGNDPSLIIVRKKNGHYEIFQAKILEVLDKDKLPKKDLVPNYYRNSIEAVSIWFKIAILEPLEEQYLKKLTLLSNSSPLLKTLKSCRTTLMLVMELA